VGGGHKKRALAHGYSIPTPSGLRCRLGQTESERQGHGPLRGWDTVAQVSRAFVGGIHERSAVADMRHPRLANLFDPDKVAVFHFAQWGDGAERLAPDVRPCREADFLAAGNGCGAKADGDGVALNPEG